MPSIGTLGIDVKAKKTYQGQILIDLYERETTANFEFMFALPVWYACFPPNEPGTCYLFLNQHLMQKAPARRARKPCVAVDLATEAHAVRYDETPLHAAIMGYIFAS